MPPKSKPPRRENGTLNALAAGLNISKRQVSTLLSQGMPEDVAAARRWRRDRNGMPADYATARARKMQADAERSEIALAKERGLLISRAEVVELANQTGAALQAFWRALEREIPTALLGLNLERSRPLAKQMIRAQQKYLSDANSHFWQEHPEKTATAPNHE
jgi:hypothetical protein